MKLNYEISLKKKLYDQYTRSRKTKHIVKVALRKILFKNNS